MRRTALALAVAVTAAAGCYESPVPLDPAPQADLDPGVIGSWRCLGSSTDSTGEAVTLAVKRVRERVYEADFLEEGQKPDRYEVHASLLKGKTVVNVRDLDATSDKPWSFARYELVRPDILEIRVADDEALKGTEPTPVALRKRFEAMADDPRLFGGYCVCVRQKKP